MGQTVDVFLILISRLVMVQIMPMGQEGQKLGEISNKVKIMINMFGSAAELPELTKSLNSKIDK